MNKKILLQNGISVLNPTQLFLKYIQVQYLCGQYVESVDQNISDIYLTKNLRQQGKKDYWASDIYLYLIEKIYFQFHRYCNYNGLGMEHKVVLQEFVDKFYVLKIFAKL